MVQRNIKSKYMGRRLLADPIAVQRLTNRLVRMRATVGPGTAVPGLIPDVSYRTSHNGKLRPIKPKRRHSPK